MISLAVRCRLYVVVVYVVFSAAYYRAMSLPWQLKNAVPNSVAEDTACEEQHLLSRVIVAAFFILAYKFGSTGDVSVRGEGGEGGGS